MYLCFSNYHIGLVVRASTLRAEDPRFESHLQRDFSGLGHTSNLGTPVATLPGAWRCSVSSGTGGLVLL